MSDRDNLPGTEREGVLRVIELPGKIILWIFYMFPTGGYSQTRMSARWARSPIMTLIIGGLFWLALAGFFILLLLDSFLSKGS